MRLHDAREIAGGASGRNGGFALRGGAAPVRRHRRVDRARRHRGRTGARPSRRSTGSSGSRATPLAGRAASVSPPTTRSATSSRSSRGAPRRRIRRRVDRGAAWQGRFRAAIFHPNDAALQPARWVRRLAVLAAEAGVEIHEHSRVESLDGRRRRPRPRRHRRLPERPARRDRGADRPDPRPDDRHRAAARADLRLPALRPARLRLLAADSGRAHPRRRLPRLGAPGRVHDRRGDDAGHPGRARSRSSPSSSAARCGSTTAGPGCSGWCWTSCRWSAASPARSRAWVAGGYSGHGNVLGLLCGELAAQAMLGREAPELALFDPARLLAA